MGLGASSGSESTHQPRLTGYLAVRPPLHLVHDRLAAVEVPTTGGGMVRGHGFAALVDEGVADAPVVGSAIERRDGRHAESEVAASGAEVRLWAGRVGRSRAGVWWVGGCLGGRPALVAAFRGMRERRGGGKEGKEVEETEDGLLHVFGALWKRWGRSRRDKQDINQIHV